ncbi:MAG: hypothetical protein K0R98_1732 [Rickettsiaceae bacterium]|jgi:hypothetical protein|nr:hypothetical protein [Rickettsiaceae bacterium]
MVKEIDIAKDFSRYPAGRNRTDGEFTATHFRDDILVPALKKYTHVSVQLDGAAGYGSSFLEEAFGGIVRNKIFTKEDLHKNLTIKSVNELLVEEIWQHINEA